MNIPRHDPAALKSLELVWAERLRQKEVEGHTPAHDDEHTEGQLALLAAAYALWSRGKIPDSSVADMTKEQVDIYGWSFKPTDPIRDLTRAGALILAELERRLRAEGKKPEHALAENVAKMDTETED